MDEYYKMFVDAWRFFKLYNRYDGSDEASKELVYAAHKETSKYHSKFFEKLIALIVSELEHNSRR